MPDMIDHQRRRFFGFAAMMVAAAEFGAAAIANAQSSAASLSMAKAKGHTSFAALKQVKAGVLDVGYAEAGPADGPITLLVHGWPYDIHSFVDVAPILAAAGYRVIVPFLRGYGTTRFLSADTPRNGQQSALAADMIALMDALGIEKAIVAGCDWGARNSAAAFDNPDHVAVTIDNYRWRLGLAEGEAKYDAYERRLAEAPAIAIPTITLEGDANGAPHPDPAIYAKKFTGKYEHRTISGGIGHNLPQEAPQAFAQAVLDVARL